MSEILVILIFVYVPGINHAFYLYSPDEIPATCALWIVPFIVIFEEVRKYLVRHNRGGCVEKMTVF